MRFTFLLAIVVCAGSALAADPATVPATRPVEPMTIMTFNLRYAGSAGPTAWQLRRPVMAELLRNSAPDIIGTQEGVYAQLKDLHSDMPGYEWIGLGREGGSRGEFMAVFYRKDRLEPLEYDHFWLSDTPEVIGSVTWGHKVKRMVTWVRFRDRKSSQEFYFVNTHLDHQVEEARQKGAALIRKRMEALKLSLPTILTGDFNTGPGSKSHQILTEGGFLADSWETAAKRLGPDIGTFHDFKGPENTTVRIDWILHRGVVTVDSIEILTFGKDGRYPSDHFPLMIRARVGEPK